MSSSFPLGWTGVQLAGSLACWYQFSGHPVLLVILLLAFLQNDKLCSRISEPVPKRLEPLRKLPILVYALCRAWIEPRKPLAPRVPSKAVRAHLILVCCSAEHGACLQAQEEHPELLPWEELCNHKEADLSICEPDGQLKEALTPAQLGVGCFKIALRDDEKGHLFHFTGGETSPIRDVLEQLKVRQQRLEEQGGSALAMTFEE